MIIFEINEALIITMALGKETPRLKSRWVSPDTNPVFFINIRWYHNDTLKWYTNKLKGYKCTESYMNFACGFFP